MVLRERLHRCPGEREISRVGVPPGLLFGLPKKFEKLGYGFIMIFLVPFQYPKGGSSNDGVALRIFL